jgi:hypothetical protein
MMYRTTRSAHCTAQHGMHPAHTTAARTRVSRAPQAARHTAPHHATWDPQDNDPAIRLYNATGFRTIKEDPWWRSLTGDRVRLLMYKLCDVWQEAR